MRRGEERPSFPSGLPDNPEFHPCGFGTHTKKSASVEILDFCLPVFFMSPIRLGAAKELLPAGCSAAKSQGCFLLLFANAFGTLANSYALTSADFPVVQILLFHRVRHGSDVFHQPWRISSSQAC